MSVISSNGVSASNYTELLESLCAARFDVDITFVVKSFFLLFFLTFTFFSILGRIPLQRGRLPGKI